MNSEGRHGDELRNVVIGSGNITAGNFENSPVVSVSGTHNRVDANISQSIQAQDPRLVQLRSELDRILPLLENDHEPARSVDRADAIEAVVTLDTDLRRPQESGLDDPGKLRKRIKGLIGVLAPIAEIIGGVAALLAIVQQL